MKISPFVVEAQVGGEAEVADSEMTFRVEQPVVRFDVPMHGAERLMRLLNRENHLRGVEPRHLFRKGISLNEKCEQVASGHIRHDEVEVVDILETVGELDNPARRGGSTGEEVPLGSEMTLLTFPEHIRFAHLLHGIQSLAAVSLGGVLEKVKHPPPHSLPLASLTDKRYHTEGAVSNSL